MFEYNRAQTETVGVALLTGVIVIAAGLVGVVVLGDVETERSTMAEIDIEVGPTAYTVTHAGGDSVPVDEVRVGVTGTSDTTVALSSLAAVDTDGDGLFEPGETYTGYHDGTATLRVLVIHDGSNTVLHDEQTDLPAGDGRLTWDTKRDWDRAATQTRVIHQAYGDHRSDRVELGYPARANGVVGFWGLDEDSGSTAFDNSGNGNNGTHEGGLTVGRSGVFATTSYGFDGSDDYVSGATDVDALRQTGSLSVWIRTTQTGDATFYQAPGLTGVESFGDGNDIFWGWLDDTGRIGIKVGDDSAAKSANPVNNGAWHHVVLTRDQSSGVIEVYVDGTLADSATSRTGEITTTFSSIGRIEDTDGTPEYFAGDIDEFRVYDRVLAGSEVTTLYQSASSGSLVTGEQQYTVPVDPAGVTLTDVAATRPSGSEVLVTVESDPDGDGTFEESSDQIRLDGSASYDITGLTTPSSRYRLRVELSSTDPTVAPTVDGLALST